MPDSSRFDLLLDASAIIIVLLMIVPLLVGERNKNAKYALLFDGAVLHLLALFFKEARHISIYSGLADERGFTYLLVAGFLDVLGLFYLIRYLFSEADGKVRFLGRSEQIPVNKVSAAVWPFLLAAFLEMLFPHMHFFGMAHSIALHLIYLIRGIERERKLGEEARNATLVQAKLLTEQIRPHFIFNALMCIEDLCYTDPEAAASRLEDFSGYLRGNIDAMTAEGPIPFERELSHIQEFIHLEKEGSNGDFEVEMDLQFTDFMIPSLTIQPIVENAIKHGALSRRDGSGKVYFSTQKVGRFIRIIVEDNGNGEAGLTEERTRHRGIGRENVEKRIAIECNGSFHAKETDQGTKVTIMIPIAGGEKHVHDHS